MKGMSVSVYTELKLRRVLRKLEPVWFCVQRFRIRKIITIIFNMRDTVGAHVIQCYRPTN